MGVERGREGSSRRAWIRFALVFCAVTVLMLVPLGASGGTPSIPHLDKLVHFGAWLVLAVTLWPPLRGARPRLPPGRVLWLLGALALWGVATELLQGLTPDRTGDVWDALADLAGAASGALLMGLRERGRPPADGAPLLPTPRENER